MLVVSDASPVNILIRIGRIDLLSQLFGTVVIPPAVVGELGHPQAPDVVRKWMELPPRWIRILQPSEIDPGVARDPGEREAICLAIELRADLLLVDDLAARNSARQAGVRIIGTVGVLELASAAGLVSLAAVFEELRQTDFRISEPLLKASLDRDASRRGPAAGGSGD